MPHQNSSKYRVMVQIDEEATNPISAAKNAWRVLESMEPDIDIIDKRTGVVTVVRTESSMSHVAHSLIEKADRVAGVIVGELNPNLPDNLKREFVSAYRKLILKEFFDYLEVPDESPQRGALPSGDGPVPEGPGRGEQRGPAAPETQ